jgi:hypothetical protein
VNELRRSRAVLGVLQRILALCHRPQPNKKPARIAAAGVRNGSL